MRSASLLGLGAILITLTACHDFLGESGRLGFASDARVGGVAWTPDTPLAQGARPHLVVSEIVDGDETEPKRVAWSVEGGEGYEEGKGIWLHGKRSGTVSAVADGVSDSFAVTWRRAKRITVQEPLAEALGREGGVLFLLEGSATEVSVEMSDARGEALGHVAEQLELSHGSAIETSLKDGGV